MQDILVKLYTADKGLRGRNVLQSSVIDSATHLLTIILFNIFYEVCFEVTSVIYLRISSKDEEGRERRREENKSLGLDMFCYYISYN